MKVPTWFYLVVLTLVGASRAGAQATASPTPRPTPPAPPFVGETQDFSAWAIVRYNVPGLSSQPPEAVIRSLTKPPKPESLISVTKTGQIRHQVKKAATGEQEDAWYEHSNRITMKSGWKLPMFEGATSGAKQPQGPDFPELSWIAAGNFVGTQESEGTIYFVFEMAVVQGDQRLAKDYGYKLSATSSRAYINADTRLPWALQTGDSIQRYFFQAAPMTALDVPREYQGMFDAYERAKIAMAKKPASP